MPVGQPIAVVGEEAEAPAPTPEPEVEAPVAESEPEAPEVEEEHPAIPLGASTAEVAPVDGVAAEPIEVPSAPAPDRRIFATPIARQMAFEAGIDLADVAGTGPGGRIVKEDIVRLTEAQAAAPAEPEPEVPVVVEAEMEAEPVVEEEVPVVAEVVEPEPEIEPEPEVVEAEPEIVVEPAVEPEVEVPVAVEAEEEEDAEEADAEPEPESDLIPLSRMRQQIARVTIRSKDEKPHFYVNTDVDMTDAMALRGQINDALADRGVRATVNDLIIAASVLALKKYPKFNAYYEDGSIRMNDDINVGIAMALEEGLIMPAVVGAGEMSLAEIAQATKDLAARANQGTLRPEEYSGGTFAVSNMGMMNVTSFVAIIQPPQTAVLAVGAVQKRRGRGFGRQHRSPPDDDRHAVGGSPHSGRRGGRVLHQRNKAAAGKPAQCDPLVFQHIWIDGLYTLTLTLTLRERG